MFLDFGVFKKLHFRPFCAQRHSTATQPGASFCARLADFAKSCDRHCMDFFDHLSLYARKSVLRAPPSFFLVFFFLFFTCWPCPSFLLIFNTFSNSFSDFPSYFVYQRRHFWSRPLAGVAGRRISSINVVIFCTKCYSRWGFGILQYVVYLKISKYVTVYCSRFWVWPAGGFPRTVFFFPFGVVSQI